MWEDPIVAEVRRIREEISAGFNHDPDAYFRHLREMDEQARGSGRTVISTPPPKRQRKEPDAA
ncbi:hypothetical protein [Longimicrobium sp.]|uniref:hypothetical protein n=1 Tax=Longimicrobium sp. TaxID=2029185 RepID=UPI002E35487C|nr:hypothetical protein [Longimicrobium sp.]HEX6037580.1 hypothetical protein [Longimicrobium sp.]